MTASSRWVCRVVAAILAGIAGFLVGTRLFMFAAMVLVNGAAQPARLDYLVGVVGLPGAALGGVLAGYIAFVSLAPGRARRAR